MTSWAVLPFIFLAGSAANLDGPSASGPDAVERRIGPVEVDFSRLPNSSGKDYHLYLTFETEDGTWFRETYTVGAGTQAGGVRDLVVVSIPGGWKVETVGATKLILRGYKRSPLTWIGISVPELPKKATPTLRRLKKGK
jgi:hypothetical protein